MQPTTDRRSFLKAGSISAAGLSLGSWPKQMTMQQPIKIAAVNSNFERQPLRRPFGFKGSAMTNVWQTVAWLADDSGNGKAGLGTQNVLWSDARVFASHSEEGGNALMYAMSEYALQMVKGQSFDNPHQLLDAVLPDVLAYGRKITNHDGLRTTFALNALVALDNAAWLLYADTNKMKSFDAMVPPEFQSGLSARHDKVVSIPALGYGTPIEEIVALVERGFFIMKIKIGAPGDRAEMLEKDKAFLKAIHSAIGHYETSHTADGKLPYYFDANGRYESQDDLLRFLDYAESIGALEQIAVLEEPFGERNQEDVSQITARGVRVAADESAHTDQETISRIEQGYNAIAVKAVAKTLSMTMRIAQAAYQRGVPCFCADLTVNPILVEWNKTVAARLPAFPNLAMGLQETNGWQNYRNWGTMMGRHPAVGRSWTRVKQGVFPADDAFYDESAGIFLPVDHYLDMVT